MRRAAFDDSSDRLPAFESGGPLPCSLCNRPTPRAILAQYGARCAGCYGHFCRSVPQRPEHSAHRGLDGPRGWAQALRRREESGERLTPAQRAAWRAAIGALADAPEAA